MIAQVQQLFLLVAVVSVFLPGSPFDPAAYFSTLTCVSCSVSNSVFGFGQKSRFYGFFSPKPTRLALKPTFLKPTFLAVENRI